MKEGIGCLFLLNGKNMPKNEWKKHQKWEQSWHGDCVNSFWEETKQIVYAKRMGLVPYSDRGKYPVFNLEGKSVLDIGSGPYSLLLKCVNFSKAYAVDPCDYPKWTKERYEIKGIEFVQKKGEEIEGYEVDEVWIYNCLQHTINPEEIIKNAKKISKIIRIFEWVDTGTSIGHPHELKEFKLNDWLGGIGKVEDINESGCHGRCFYGIFKGDRYG